MMNLVNTHNSPKYNSCFVSALYLVEATLNGMPVTTTKLIDAFERSTVASTAIGCGRKLRAGIRKSQLSVGSLRAVSGSKPVASKRSRLTARRFIEDHMRNRTPRPLIPARVSPQITRALSTLRRPATRAGRPRAIPGAGRRFWHQGFVHTRAGVEHSLV